MIDYRKAFDAVTADPRYQANLDWGEPRPGHPEGTVRAHLAEIEPNLETLRHHRRVHNWQIQSAVALAV